MKSEQATLLVHCRFPTGAGNRVRVIIDGQTAGELRRPLRVRAGHRHVRVTSWGLPLCGSLRVSCPAGFSVELALKVNLPGFVLGMVLFLAGVTVLAPLAAILTAHVPGCEVCVALAMAAAFIAVCLLDFYVLLPGFSVYTFRLVELGADFAGSVHLTR